jgi:uroporphyrinogen decarboxylase
VLTSRERVEKALSHQEADRVPLDLGSTPFTTIHLEVARKLHKHFGLEDAGYEFISFGAQAVRPHPYIREQFSIDTYGVFSAPPDDFTLEVKDDTFIDEWGMKHKKMPRSFQYDFIGHPLSRSTVEDLKHYPWPDPKNAGRFSSLLKETRDIFDNTDLAVILNPPQGAQIRELGAWLTGYEKHFMDIGGNHRYVETLSGILLDWHKSWLELALAQVGEYISVVAIADDLGIQTGPIFNPEAYRSLYKPFHRELISFIKERTKARIFFHSCGSVEKFIPDLIEIGVDILNPIQVSATNMDIGYLKKEYGDDLVFWGAACDSQKILPFGPVSAICTEVANTVAALKQGGGYVFAPIHNILPDVETEKVLALFGQARKHGLYQS